MERCIALSSERLIIGMGCISISSGVYSVCGDVRLCDQCVPTDIHFPREWNLQRHEHLFAKQQLGHSFCVHSRYGIFHRCFLLFSCSSLYKGNPFIAWSHGSNSSGLLGSFIVFSGSARQSYILYTGTILRRLPSLSLRCSTQSVSCLGDDV